MPSLWFVMPAHGRLELSRICMSQLRRTCDLLTSEGVEATAVVVACDENLDTARGLGFGTVERDNVFLSRRFNDGIQLALDPEFNPRPATHVVPIGSDDWVDHRLFLNPPGGSTMVGFQRMAFVREDGRELTVRHLNYDGGSGIRIYPRQMMAQLGYRPADEDRVRACDTSILTNLKAAGAVRRIDHRPVDPLSIVDWKTVGEQVTSYAEVNARHPSRESWDPFDVLSGRFPDEALEEMQAHYGRVAVAA